MGPKWHDWEAPIHSIGRSTWRIGAWNRDAAMGAGYGTLALGGVPSLLLWFALSNPVPGYPVVPLPLLVTSSTLLAVQSVRFAARLVSTRTWTIEGNERVIVEARCGPFRHREEVQSPRIETWLHSFVLQGLTLPGVSVRGSMLLARSGVRGLLLAAHPDSEQGRQRPWDYRDRLPAVFYKQTRRGAVLAGSFWYAC